MALTASIAQVFSWPLEFAIAEALSTAAELSGEELTGTSNVRILFLTWICFCPIKLS